MGSGWHLASPLRYPKEVKIPSGLGALAQKIIFTSNLIEKIASERFLICQGGGAIGFWWLILGLGGLGTIPIQYLALLDLGPLLFIILTQTKLARRHFSQ